jgi:hypothetical protein
LILAEERKSQEEIYTKPVMRGEGGIFDPMTLINEIKECIEVDLSIE